MQKIFLLSYALAAFSSQFAVAWLPDGRPHANVMRPPTIPFVQSQSEGPVVSRDGIELPPYDTTYTFDQLIDHNNPTLGTFKQRFWHTYEYYKQGGPIILSTPGESNANGYFVYLTNVTLPGQIAQRQNGSTIVLEHRFYGFSNPRPDLSVESLRLHTIQQAIEDLVYFANNVNLPMPGGNQVTPDKTPWILVGGSYSGALTSWTMVNKPGVFFIGYASSAVVQARLNFWEYFEPIRTHMPRNCSADVQAVIKHIDRVFLGRDQSAIQKIKDTFGMGNVTHLDDVAGALRNNLWDWQSLQPVTGPGAQFYQFCDALEVNDGKNAPAEGWGLDHALAAWGSYFKNTYYSHLCGTVDAETCLGTYNPTLPFWTDTSINNSWRSWFWIVCNEVGYLQVGAPIDYPSLVTRLTPPSYDLRQCQQMFPAAFSKPPMVPVDRTNKLYKGWDVKLNRIFFANAQRDPWKDATVSATHHTVQSTSEQPIAISERGFHCSELRVASGVSEPSVGAVQAEAYKHIGGWLTTWKPNPKPHTAPVSKISVASPELFAPTVDHIKPINAFFKGAGTA